MPLNSDQSYAWHIAKDPIIYRPYTLIKVACRPIYLNAPNPI